MSFLLSLFNIFLNCNRKWGIIVKIGVVIGGKRTIIGGRRGIIGTSSADRAQTDECSVDAVGMYIEMFGMGMGMLVASVGIVGMDIGMIGMGVLVGMAQPSGNSVGVAFS